MSSIPARAARAVALAAAAVVLACGGPRGAPHGARPVADDPAAAAAPDAATADATDAAVTPRAYELELEIDPDAAGYAGTIAIDVDVAARTTSFVLDARDLRIERAHLDVRGERVALAPSLDDAAGQVVLAAPRAIEPGEARLELRFAAAYRRDDAIFAQTYRGRSYVFSDFEPIDARRAFPCFDAPHLKTPWTVSLVVPDDAVALANAPEVGRTRVGADRVRVAFAATPPLPTYLVSIAVGPFELVSTEGGPVPVRIAVPAGRGGAAERARVAAPALLDEALRLLDRPVPFDKIDFVAVPRFGGAMENPGLITVAADILLDGGGAANDRYRALVIAHEVAHLWFGDSVTLADWRDLWIQEGLASWMADELLARWRPAWATRRDELRARVEAMREDDVPGAHPLRPAVLPSPRALFDVLTYQKSAAVLHMIEDWVGPERFVGALRGYLDAHALGSVTSADLRAALAPLAEGLDEVLDALTAEAGVPYVDAAVRCGERGATVALAVRARDGGDAPWTVPACVRWHDGAAARRACALVREPVELALGARCPAWVHPNADGSGYYRWSLDGAALADALTGAGATDRERIDAAHAIRDALDAGAPIDGVADALAAAARSGVPEAVAIAVDGYALLHRQVAPDEARDELARHLRAALAPALRRLGTARRAGESADDRRLRAIVLAAAGTLGDDRATIKWARKAARRWLRDPARGPAAELVEPALLVAATHADKKLAAALLDRAAGATDDPSLDPTLLARALGRMPRARALRALDAALAGGLTSGGTFALAIELLGRADTAADAADALARHGDWLALAVTFAPVCDPAIVERVAAAPVTAGDAGFAAALARRKVEAERCAALRPLARDAARAFGR